MATSRLQKVSRVKEENKRNIAAYLGDPDNEWLHRTLPPMLYVKNNCIDILLTHDAADKNIYQGTTL
jgi:hypothetical protein